MTTCYGTSYRPVKMSPGVLGHLAPFSDASVDRSSRTGRHSGPRALGGAAARMSHHDSAATVCGNCGVPLGGDFCHACGQRALGPDVSLHDFFHEAFEEFAHVDGKIVQTLRLLLTKPGMLTREFLDGRRV